ncbi:MAG: DsbA family protein [Alphaproteobacteria bacterium]|nr:DsbA family protein [Alphaproteobacteria bacterium]MBL7098713.1 DsbA family protein [Alphaproteobacteria bacterium]
MSRNQVLIGIIVAAILALGGGWYFLIGPGADGDTGGGTTSGKLQITADDMTLGNPNAPVQVVEYAAPMCPHCAHMNEEGFPVLKKDYIDKGKVFYVFRVFPIGQPDIPAEGIARCLPKANYFAFIDLLFRNQQKWDPEYQVTDVHGGLVALGRIAGLAPDKIETCMADPANQQRIMASQQDASTRLGITGTPTFVINGDVLPGGAQWATVKEKLDAALAAQK